MNKYSLKFNNLVEKLKENQQVEIVNCSTLKKLEIWWGCTFNEDNLSENISKFTALELNLFDNKISDIRMLNKLPNLTQVDLACNEIGPQEVAEQLENPEIACFMGRPHVHFIVGGSEIF